MRRKRESIENKDNESRVVIQVVKQDDNKYRYICRSGEKVESK